MLLILLKRIIHAYWRTCINKFITHAFDLHQNPMGFAWHFSKQINNYVEKRNWIPERVKNEKLWKG